MSVGLRALMAGVSAALVCLSASAPRLTARQSTIDQALFQTLSWRSIGPFRGGRTTAVAGVASQPNVFYAGSAGGGGWKTTDAGRSWRPIFDAQSTGAIGAIAVAPSDPNIIYVGTGAEPAGARLAAGAGLFRSDDAGRTWRSLGLAHSQRIPRIIVDPVNPARVFVAVMGRAFGPSTERGVFRSLDGGRTFDRVLFTDADTGAFDLAFESADPTVVYAALRQVRYSPWDDATFSGPGTALYKSTDGGTMWRLVGDGLPTFATDGLDRISLAVAPSARGRLMAVISARTRGGLYTSTDGGERWTLVNGGPEATLPDGAARHAGFDPRDAGVVYLTGTRAWKSTDGGRTFDEWRRDPEGGGFDQFWINPSHPDAAVLSGDRGAIVTVNGGASWSSTDNQPTGQFSRVATDAVFPYRICGAERLGAPACTPSRGDSGRLTPADWRIVGATLDSFTAPDPNDADIVYSGAVGRYDRKSGQVQNVAPPGAADERAHRDGRPVLFSPTDSRSLLFATNMLWKSSNAGQIWTPISPLLTREHWEWPINLGPDRVPDGTPPARRGVISAVGASAIDGRVIWTGSDDGVIHATRNGGVTWTNVTPSAVGAWAYVASIEPSRFDANTAYAAVDMRRLDDDGPHLWRTRDAGATWVDIARGLPADGAVYAVREDPFRRGLLFAATERSVFLSFDDGDSWRPLRLNLPPVPIRDLSVREADVVAATDGRGFWVLDDITPLRQITADMTRAGTFLFRPAVAWRMRPAAGSGTLAPDEPAAANPPDGSVLHYLIGPETTGPATLEIIETTSGDVIRRYANDAARMSDAPVDRTSPDRLVTTPGLHRLVWDLRYTAVAGSGAWVLPGTYQVRLTAGGRIFRQGVVVRIDPRVRASLADLTAQLKLSQAVDDTRREVMAAQRRLRQAGATPPAALDAAMRDLSSVFERLQESDVRPTAATESIAATTIERATAVLAALD